MGRCLKVPENHGSGMQFGGRKALFDGGRFHLSCCATASATGTEKYYNIRTEQAYCDSIRRFIIFHGKRHPSGVSRPTSRA
jgi:hypothetical protein